MSEPVVTTLRLKKRQMYQFSVSGPCRVSFARIGGGNYQVTVSDPEKPVVILKEKKTKADE
jgi:hypothetical protein